MFPEIITEVEKDGKTIKTINADKLKELIGDYAKKGNKTIARKYSIRIEGKRS